MKLAIAAILAMTTMAAADDKILTLEQAKQQGLKVSIVHPNPVACPALGPVIGDLSKYRATGMLAKFEVGIEGFLREDFTAAMAATLLGKPVLCSAPSGGYMNVELAPRAPHVYRAMLELHDGDLIGIVIELDKVEVPVDITALAKQYKHTRSITGPHGPPHDTFSATSPAFDAQLMFGNTAWPKSTTHQVREVIYRRTARIELLPDKFTTVADAARLVKLALHPKAPDTVKFYGTLGVFDRAHTTADTDAFLPAIDMRNVAAATIRFSTTPGRKLVKTINVKFGKPLAGDAAALAKVLGATVAKTGELVLPTGSVRVAGTGGISELIIARN